MSDQENTRSKAEECIAASKRSRLDDDVWDVVPDAYLRIPRINADIEKTKQEDRETTIKEFAKEIFLLGMTVRGLGVEDEDWETFEERINECNNVVVQLLANPDYGLYTMNHCMNALKDEVIGYTGADAPRPTEDRTEADKAMWACLRTKEKEKEERKNGKTKFQ